jgi:hypothetical protein
MSNNLIVAPTASLLARDSNPFLDDAGPGGLAFGEYIKFVKEGRIIDREKDDVIDVGEVFIPHMMGIRHGWQCWKETKKVDEYVALVVDGKPFPAESSLTDHGPYKTYPDGTTDGWSEYYELPLIVELDDGTADQYTLQLGSKSGINGIKSLLREYGGKYMKKIGEDGNLMFPVVEFDTNSFTVKDNPKVGTLYAPKFSIVDWANATEVVKYFDGLQDDGSEDPDNYEGDGEQAALPAPEAAPAEEAPAPAAEKPKAKRAGRKAAAVQTAEPAADDDAVDADVAPADPKPAPARGRRKPRNV